MPSFENEVLIKNSKQIHPSFEGIYRYLNKRGDVIYIGKGGIKDRLDVAHRANWNIEKIEYSIIENEEDQFIWEDYWLDRFKSENNSELPLFNKISGNKTYSNIK